jgi:hypothetical protein
MSAGFPVQSLPLPLPAFLVCRWSSAVSSLRFLDSSGAGAKTCAGAEGVNPGASPDSARSLRRPGEGFVKSYTVNGKRENIPQREWSRTLQIESGGRVPGLWSRLSRRNVASPTYQTLPIPVLPA